MPRVAPITGKADVPAEHHAVVDAVVNVFGNVRGPFSVLLHSPKLALRMLPLVTFFRDESLVEAKLRSIAILTAVREREAAYVWAAQVGAARRNGLGEEIIDLIRAQGDLRGAEEPARRAVAGRADDGRALLRAGGGGRQRLRGRGAAGRRHAAGVAPYSF
ncbi:MAG: hypothetical protein HY614_09640 [Candidatus Rokubacteria bacterium]|nr:hypothetical protein [Candidatus Rokubacteria bacterium]